MNDSPHHNIGPSKPLSESWLGQIDSSDHLNWPQTSSAALSEASPTPPGVARRLPPAPHKHVKAEHLAAFCWQLATMLEGGVPITEAIDTITEDISNPHLCRCLNQISLSMRAGETFSDGIARFPRVFNPLFSAMILAGENSGSLITILHRLAEFYENRDRLLRKVKAAVAYPIFMFFFVVFIVVMMMVFIIPRFRTIFQQIKGEIPAFTQTFMYIYDLIIHNVGFLLLLLALVVVAVLLYAQTAKGHRFCSKLVLSLPILGKLLSFMFIAVFCRTLSTLLAAGVSILEALEILSGMTSNDLIKNAIAQTKQHIVEGDDISFSISASGFFPHMVTKMAQVGEFSGSLPLVLDRTSQFYEKKVDTSVRTLIGILEPALIIIVAAIVLVVVLALYLPIFTITNFNA